MINKIMPMNPNKKSEAQDWDGVDTREVRRRYLFDRRMRERRKRYWWSIIFPIFLGSVLTALISWGVYVTHVTYRISAGYEETFVKHIENEIQEAAALEHKMEMMKIEYTGRLDSIRSETMKQLSEIRAMQSNMYQLLLDNERRRNDVGGMQN